MSAYTTINGQTVHKAVAAAYWLMATAFRRRFGLILYISSGKRTYEQQVKLFTTRYRVQWIGRGPFGDVRWWKGRRYVRYSSLGTVAVPGTSLHESDRAIDIRDSGADAGVTVAGTVRSNWIKANARRFGFNPRGFTFGEPWHLEFLWALIVPAGLDVKPIAQPKPAEEDDMDFRYFTRTNPTTKKAEWAITHPLYFANGVLITTDISLATGFAPYTGTSELLTDDRWAGMLKIAKIAYDAAWAAEAKKAALASTVQLDYGKVSEQITQTVSAAVIAANEATVQTILDRIEQIPTSYTLEPSE